MNRKPRLFVFAIACATAAMVTLWPAEAAAQRGRVIPRPGTRTVTIGRTAVRPVYRPVIYTRPYYSYRPYYPSSFYLSFWLGRGYYDYWGSPYYYYYDQYPYPYPRYPYRGYYEAASDLRIQVTPRQAEVYVDGYLVGTVDDFDGVLQRLRVPYGEHEIEIYLEGFRTIRERMLFRPGESYHIRQTMQPLNGQPPEPRPAPRAGGPEGYPRQGPEGYGRQAPPPDRPRDRGAEPVRPPVEPERVERGMFGTLSLRVQPADVEILIDGERWDTTPGEARFVLDLAEGTHRIEIRKEGYKPYTTELRVRRGETIPLNVVLPRGD
ncbi:MAG: hypothetical protein A3H96_13250 [Acidobacteria bacterium RIFCSPLOWO2_02_FULL_67_36]|nr:MAG: hypothetical protein A3H96_13250 [Acidobacteria bacterium RIFCSPLOWO2_02_FULL_67_36]